METTTNTIWSAHHASHSFFDAQNGVDYRSRCALTPLQQEKLSDYGTDITVPTNGVLTMRSQLNRALGDLNRKKDNAFRPQDFGKIFRDGRWHADKHDIWLPGQQPTDAEKEQLLTMYWDPYYARILEELRRAKRPMVVVAFDNTANYKIGENTDGSDRIMMNIDVANDGAKGKPGLDEKGEERKLITTCDPKFLQEFAYQLSRALREQGLRDDVTRNEYDDEEFNQCGDLAKHFNTRGNVLDVPNEVQAIQIEYNTFLTHLIQDHALVADFDAMVKLRIAIERAMYATYVCTLPHNVGVTLPEVKTQEG
jgi:hypothetical protein